MQTLIELDELSTLLNNAAAMGTEGLIVNKVESILLATPLHVSMQQSVNQLCMQTIEREELSRRSGHRELDCEDTGQL